MWIHGLDSLLLHFRVLLFSSALVTDYGGLNGFSLILLHCQDVVFSFPGLVWDIYVAKAVNMPSDLSFTRSLNKEKIVSGTRWEFSEILYSANKRMCAAPQWIFCAELL